MKAMSAKNFLIPFLITAALVIGGGFSPLHAAVDAKKLYKKTCKKCHGKRGEGKKEKKNPGKFKYNPVNDVEEQKLLEAMLKYKLMWEEKTFENSREKKMAKSVRKLSEEEMKILASFIPTLGKQE